MDGVEPLKDVTIIAATNRPDIIDRVRLNLADSIISNAVPECISVNVFRPYFAQEDWIE
jgi:AAA+ superfamily predicted ATPase